MKGLAPLFLGIFGTFTFSWVGLTVIPNWQIGHLNPESDEEGTDIYPQPQSGMVQRGAHVYAANGCVYCHSQQVRADYAANDIERGWGNRRSAPLDYIFKSPVFLGKMRMGQDIANMGTRAPAEQESLAPRAATSPAASLGSSGTSPMPATSPSTQAQAASPVSASAAANSSPSNAGSPAATVRAGTPASASPVAQGAAGPATSPSTTAPPWPIQTEGLPPLYSAAWHHVHLYSPRSINLDSNMPAYRFLYERRRITGERSADALQLSGADVPAAGWQIVPTYDARCLVAYLMALNQSHPLKGIRSVGGASAAAAAPAPATQGASPAAPSPAAAKK